MIHLLRSLSKRRWNAEINSGDSDAIVRLAKFAQLDALNLATAVHRLGKAQDERVSIFLSLLAKNEGVQPVEPGVYGMGRCIPEQKRPSGILRRSHIRYLEVREQSQKAFGALLTELSQGLRDGGRRH